MNANMELIELLTWASVEVTKPGKIDVEKLSKVIDLSLHQALLSQEREMNAKAALIKTAQVAGV